MSISLKKWSNSLLMIVSCTTSITYLNKRCYRCLQRKNYINDIMGNNFPHKESIKDINVCNVKLCIFAHCLWKQWCLLRTESKNQLPVPYNSTKRFTSLWYRFVCVHNLRNYLPTRYRRRNHDEQ